MCEETFSRMTRFQTLAILNVRSVQIQLNIRKSLPVIPDNGVPEEVERVAPAGEVPHERPCDQLQCGPDGVQRVEADRQGQQHAVPVLHGVMQRDKQSLIALKLVFPHVCSRIRV